MPSNAFHTMNNTRYVTMISSMNLDIDCVKHWMQVSDGVTANGCYILVIVNLLSLAFMRVLSPQTHMINVLWALARLCCATQTWSIDCIWIMQISRKGCLNSCELLYIVMVEIDSYFSGCPNLFIFAKNILLILGCVQDRTVSVTWNNTR